MLNPTHELVPLSMSCIVSKKTRQHIRAERKNAWNRSHLIRAVPTSSRSMAAGADGSAFLCSCFCSALFGRSSTAGAGTGVCRASCFASFSPPLPLRPRERSTGSALGGFEAGFGAAVTGAGGGAWSLLFLFLVVRLLWGSSECSEASSGALLRRDPDMSQLHLAPRKTSAGDKQFTAWL